MPTFGFEGENAREKVIVLLTMCFALAMAMLDNTVVNVALPTIRNDLSAGISQLQWIVDGYVLAFASLLLTGGIMGDRYGRKKMFVTGLVVFTLSSLGCGLSQSTEQLIGFRAIQGIGAALLMPGTLSIITVTFPAHERARAIGLWAGMSGLALALGPTIGGLMVEHLGWQSVFFLNVPIGATAFFVALRTVRESTSEIERRLDIPGLALGTSALFFLTYALIEANQRGWSDVQIVGSFVLAAVLGAAFLFWETRNPHAMMPLRFFGIPAFSAGNAVAFSVSLGMFAMFFFFSIYLQSIHHYTPFEAGYRFLPMTLLIIVTAPNAGKFAQRHGSRIPMTYGLVLAGSALVLLGLTTKVDTSYWYMLPIFTVMGHGIGATMAPMTAAVMNAVGPQRAGLGSAMTNTSREVGGVLGIAVLGAILTTKLRNAFVPALAGLGLSPQQQAIVGTAAGQGDVSKDALRGIPPHVQEQIFRAFSTSFMDGFRLALLFGGAVLLIGAVIAFTWIPHGGHREDVSHDEAPREPVAIEV